MHAWQAPHACVRSRARTSVPKRGCGLMHASGMKSDRILSPLGAAAGTVKSPQPIIGKQGSVGPARKSAERPDAAKRRD
eukprot:1078344-Pleurochrysis_carterae.AAC.1